ncbi:MAG: hypothetical protein KDA84_20755, partial [Planctomycetaceae bacterium]|nr:hypothetical protein [Planctomycetaceae bacterium]
GNFGHRALGTVEARILWEADRRWVQIHTESRVRIEHDPLDEVHPLIELNPGENYLVGKLPGFSNPALELPDKREGLG